MQAREPGLKETTPVPPLIWNFSLQNGETINVLFKPSSVWYDYGSLSKLVVTNLYLRTLPYSS